MMITLQRWLLLVSLSTTFADDNPELPLCPTSPQYFPQKLPMHCKMPVKVDQPFPDLPQYPTLPPLPQSYFQSESPDKQPPPIPIPIPPFPRMPGAMPGPIAGPMPGPMPGMVGPMPGMVGPMPGMPGPMPMPMPMVGPPAHKLPVIVMPFYSQDHSMKKQRTSKPKHGKKRRQRPYKKKKKFYQSHIDTDTDTDTDSSSSSSSDSDDTTSSDEHGFWKGRKSGRKMARQLGKQHKNRKKELRNKKKNLLTPILQYVTKDGYVIFEKQISKNEAKDWLKTKTEINGVEGKDEQKPQEKPEANPKLEEENANHFNPKSAEDFLKADEEDQRVIATELSKEAAENEEATKIEKKQHGHVKLNPFTNNSNELPQR